MTDKATSIKLAKAAGWLLVVGPLLDILLVSIRPGGFLTDDPGGPVEAILAWVEALATNTGLSNLSVELGLVVSLAFVLGLYCTVRLLKDGSWSDHLRMVGFLIVMIAYTLRAASYATLHLSGNLIKFGVGADGAEATFEYAVIITALAGSITVFSTLLLALGVAVFAWGMMHLNVIGGSDRILAMVLGILPAAGVFLLMLIGAHSDNNVLTLFFLGNLMALDQVIWTTWLGVALIRRGDQLPVPAG
ncbi:MAG: hypothetical protein F4211_02160 [Acidimicrobiia bacterium]|nr:hypothetical protein [Acidimicrobiia bacterium]